MQQSSLYPALYQQSNGVNQQCVYSAPAQPQQPGNPAPGPPLAYIQPIPQVHSQYSQVKSRSVSLAPAPAPNVGPVRNRRPLLCCCVCPSLLCLLGVAIGLITLGMFLINLGNELTEETCLYTDYIAEECWYDCNCKTVRDHNGDRREECDRCEGTQYRYTATAEEKCPDQRLDMAEIHLECPDNNLKEMDTEFTCYVWDCEKGRFTYTHLDIYTVAGIVAVVFACVCILVALILVFCAKRRGCECDMPCIC